MKRVVRPVSARLLISLTAAVRPDSAGLTDMAARRLS
jgi:hypothetical protein